MVLLRDLFVSKTQMKTSATLIIVFTIILFTGACDTETDGTDPFKDAVKVESDDGLVSLLIPPGAAPEGTVFSIEVNNDPVPDGSIGKTYSLGPEDTYFDPPAKLIFNYKDEDLPSGISTNNLALAKLVDNQWLPLYSNLDEDENEIKSPVAKLSTFGLIQIEPGKNVASSEIKAWSQDIYNALDNGQDLAPIIEDILAYFAPVFDTEDDSHEDLVYECIYAGVPFFLDAHSKDIAQGYSQGIMVDADSFFQSLNQAGFDESTEIIMLDYNNVWTHIWFYIITDALMQERDEFYPHEVLPALLYYLSLERGGSQPDAWGDGYLDPLQFTLLNYAFNYAAIDMGGEVETAIFKRKNIRRMVTGWVGRIIGVPTDYEEAAKECIIAPQYLYSYLIDLELDPDLIHKKQLEIVDPPDYESYATVQVDFYHETGPFRQRLLDYLEFELPENGPQPDKPVEWTLQTPIMWRSPEDVDLSEHGEISSGEFNTDEEGKARATYTAEDEIDEDQRETQTSDTGHIYVRIKDLMLGRMRGVERAVVAMNPEVGEDWQRLTVNYWLPSPNAEWVEPLKPPPLDL